MQAIFKLYIDLSDHSKMRVQYSFLATLIVQQFILYSSTDRVAVKAESNAIKSGSPLTEDECTTWHYRDHNGWCQCYPQNVHNMPKEWIRCSNDTVILVYGNCMTYSKNTRSTYVAECPYFQVNDHKVSHLNPGYIKLPLNISKLNEYMCGPVNRKGLLCSECIDGFGTSFTSIEHSCSNCTNSYGIPLYILAEIVPLTLFYLIIHISFESI